MQEELLLEIFQNNLEYLGTLTSSSMLWWVSAVVFCGSIISATWIKREEIREFRSAQAFFTILSLFFLSIILYGAWIIYTVNRLQEESLAISTELGKTMDIFQFQALKIGVGIGTTSFVLVLIAWFIIWVSLFKVQLVSRDDAN